MAQQKERDDGKSGRQLKMMMEYGQLEKNWSAKEMFSHCGEMVSGWSPWRDKKCGQEFMLLQNELLIAAQLAQSSRVTDQAQSLDSAHGPASLSSGCTETTDTSPPARDKHLLVMVDQLPGWAGAFPTWRADSGGAVNAWLKEVIPDTQGSRAYWNRQRCSFYSKYNPSAVQVFREREGITYITSLIVFRRSREN